MKEFRVNQAFRHGAFLHHIGRSDCSDLPDQALAPLRPGNGSLAPYWELSVRAGVSTYQIDALRVFLVNKYSN